MHFQSAILAACAFLTLTTALPTSAAKDTKITPHAEGMQQPIKQPEQTPTPREMLKKFDECLLRTQGKVNNCIAECGDPHAIISYLTPFSR